MDLVAEDQVFDICKTAAPRYVDNAAITRFIMFSDVKTDGFRKIWVAIMLSNLVEHAATHERKRLVINAIKSDAKEDVDTINRLLTLQLEDASQFVDALCR